MTAPDPDRMVEFIDVTATYVGAASPTLDSVSFVVPEGELCLVVGPTGSGKSTLLNAISGLFPRFSGGELNGIVRVGGRSTAEFPPRELADVVGTVGQDPAAGFVTDTVENELAYVMENLGLSRDVMRRRIEDTLDLLDLAPLRRRGLSELSGGQQQRVAIGAVLAAQPSVLVLDEPTSALDPASADEVLSALARLVHDLGLTVVMAEHRLERVVQFADLVVHVPGGAEPVVVGDPREVLVDPAPRPPVVRLGELAGWSPIPLTVREARRFAAPLREQLGAAAPGHAAPASGGAAASVSVDGLWASYGDTVALRGVSMSIAPGEIVALMGRNGSGKSTLLGHLAGLHKPRRGTIAVDGSAPHGRRPRDLVRSVGLLPQDFGILLFAASVEEECLLADHDAGLALGSTMAHLRTLVANIDPSLHPRDLSEGQRLALAISVVAAPGPAVLCLDEPTRGLDATAKAQLVADLRELAAGGTTILMATHDVELVAEVAERVVLMAEGEIVDDGPARHVVCQSPVFAPQVARVMAPAEWLTVEDVRRGLGMRGRPEGRP